MTVGFFPLGKKEKVTKTACILLIKRKENKTSHEHAQ